MSSLWFVLHRKPPPARVPLSSVVHDSHNTLTISIHSQAPNDSVCLLWLNITLSLSPSHSLVSLTNFRIFQHNITLSIDFGLTIMYTYR